MNKKQFILLSAIFLLTLASCSKSTVGPEDHHPQMRYIDLQQFSITQGKTKAIDLNGDGKKDFSFGTTLVGDPVLKRDRLFFEVNSTIATFLLHNEQDETPPLSAGTVIGLSHPGFQWNEISSIMLAEKVTFASGETAWDGIWKSAQHRFLPLHIKTGGALYFGWVELSFDKQGERLILHRAAICKQANLAVQAGQ